MPLIPDNYAEQLARVRLMADDWNLDGGDALRAVLAERDRLAKKLEGYRNDVSNAGWTMADVSRLQAERDRLQAELHDYKAAASADAALGDESRAECSRLRTALAKAEAALWRSRSLCREALQWTLPHIDEALAAIREASSPVQQRRADGTWADKDGAE